MGLPTLNRTVHVWLFWRCIDWRFCCDQCHNCFWEQFSFEQKHWNILRILVGWALCELIWRIQFQLALWSFSAMQLTSRLEQSSKNGLTVAESYFVQRNVNTKRTTVKYWLRQGCSVSLRIARRKPSPFIKKRVLPISISTFKLYWTVY